MTVHAEWRVTRLIILGVTAACIVYVGWKSYQLYALFSNFCQTTVHRTIPSPDRLHVAVVFDVDCGAATGFNTQVSVIPATKPFSPKAYPSSFFVHGRHDLAIRWSGNNSLEIEIPACERVIRKDAVQAGVTLTYRQTAHEPGACWPYPARKNPG